MAAPVDGAMDAALRDPAAALRGAREAVAAAVQLGDADAEAQAERALGIVLRQTNEAGQAVAHLERARRAAHRAHSPARAAEAEATLCVIEAYAGRASRALAVATALLETLHGAARARAQAQRALILARLERNEEADREYTRSLAALRRHGDTPWLVVTLSNRAVNRIASGRYGDANRDMSQADAICLAHGYRLGHAGIRQNQAYIAAQRGEFADALRAFADAEGAFRELGLPAGRLVLDRAETLLRVRLFHDARADAERAAAEFASGGMLTDHAEALLLAARAALYGGDHATAVRSATAAERVFQRHGRPAMAVLAQAVVAEARAGRPNARTPSIRGLERAAEGLEKARWIVEAADTRLLAARLLMRRGESERAIVHLAPLAAVSTSAPAQLRVRSLHARALVAVLAGDQRRARRCVQAGLNAFERLQLAIGATELRAHAAGTITDLADLGLQLALASRRPLAALEAIHRVAVAAAPTGETQPTTADPELARSLDRLRGATGDLERALRDDHDPRPMLAAQRRAERTVLHRLRATAGSSGGAPGRSHRRPQVGRLRDALRGQTLLAFAEVDGTLHGICVTVRDRPTMWRVGPTADVRRAIENLRFARRQLLAGHTPLTARAAQRSAREAADQLDRLLLHRLAESDTAIVLHAPPALADLPWAALPRLVRRPFTLASTLARFLEEVPPPPRHRPGRRCVVLVADPALAHAEQEIAAIARAYPSVSMLPRGASAEEALALLDGADIAHIASHANLRSSHPGLSTITLHRDAITIHDLERLARPPRLLVLASCNSARTAGTPHGMLTTANALAAHGTGLIGSLGAIPDEAALALLPRLHRHLAAGTTPAVALLRLRNTIGPDHPLWIPATDLVYVEPAAAMSRQRDSGGTSVR